MKIEIDYSKDSLLDEFSLRTLEERYMVGDEKSPQEAFARAAEAFADDEAHAQRLYDYVSKQWFMFATPLLKPTVRPLSVCTTINTSSLKEQRFSNFILTKITSFFINSWLRVGQKRYSATQQNVANANKNNVCCLFSMFPRSDYFFY